MTQRSSSRSNLSLPVGVLFGVVLLALAASASAETDTGWQMRLYVAAIDMDHSSEGLTRPAGTTRGFDGDYGGGAGLNAEYRFSRRLGVDLGLFSGGSVGIEANTYRSGGTSWVTFDTLSFTPLTAGLDIHLTPESRVDFYACPLVALIQYGNLAMRSGPGGLSTNIDFDEDVAFGAGLGLGVPFGSERWSFQANVTYLDSSLKGSGVNGVQIDSGYDSTIFGLGFGYRLGRRAG